MMMLFFIRGRFMEQSPRQIANSDFTFDPTNKVVGSIDAADDAKDAMRDLTTPVCGEQNRTPNG